jgi:hypothetical protein
MKAYLILISLCFAMLASAQSDGNFEEVLPGTQGRLSWQAPGFKVVEVSAKPNGVEIGLRGQDASGKLGFLGFLFLFPEQAPLSSAKCRDQVLGPAQKSDASLKILSNSELTRSSGIPVALATYRSGKTKSSYAVRGFVATGEVCGDLEIYSTSPVNPDDPAVKAVFESFRFDPNYVPEFRHALFYAQILYEKHQYRAAAPIFEQALAKVSNDKSQLTMRRVTTDQAGMAYGISGNLAKARELFEKAIQSDPDYPLYYYNLACADAEENKLPEAKKHLQQAFDRKANVLPGESMPDPTKDDSFLPHKGDKDFWTFLDALQ